MRILFTGLYIALLFSACRPVFRSKPTALISLNFEEQDPWAARNLSKGMTVEKGPAYTGNHYAKKIKNSQFGYGYKIRFNDVSNEQIQWIKYSAMFKLNKELGDATIVCEIRDSLDIMTEWKPVQVWPPLTAVNAWIKTEARFDIHDSYRKNSTVSFYLYCSDTINEILEDDITIEFF